MIATVTLNPGHRHHPVHPGFAVAGPTAAKWNGWIPAQRHQRRQGRTPIGLPGGGSRLSGRKRRSAISEALVDRDIQVDFLEVPGETRVNLKSRTRLAAANGD